MAPFPRFSQYGLAGCARCKKVDHLGGDGDAAAAMGARSPQLVRRPHRGCSQAASRSRSGRSAARDTADGCHVGQRFLDGGPMVRYDRPARRPKGRSKSAIASITAAMALRRSGAIGGRPGRWQARRGEPLHRAARLARRQPLGAAGPWHSCFSPLTAGECGLLSEHGGLQVDAATIALLEGWVNSSSQARLKRRSRIILLLARGLSQAAVAGQLGVSRRTVAIWKQRFLEGGDTTLHDRPGRGRPKGSADAGHRRAMATLLQVRARPRVRSRRMGVTSTSCGVGAPRLGLRLRLRPLSLKSKP